MSFRFIHVLAALAFLAGVPFSSHAEEVTIPFRGMTLNANLEMADGKTFKDGTILITHGTLAHNKMEIIATLQRLLNERGFNTLAINLSLGLDNRHGMYDCKVTHRHKHSNAVREIGAWVSWLYAQGSSKIVLVGHSRGGNQTARFAAERGHPLLRHLVLMAPATWDLAAAAEAFKRRHGRPLAELLAPARALVEAGKGAQVMPGVGLLYCPGADVTAESFTSYYAADARFDTPSILGEIKLPTLVVAARGDTVVPNLAARIKPIADGKRLRFALIDGADHFFLDLFAEDIGDQVETLLKGGG